MQKVLLSSLSHFLTTHPAVFYNAAYISSATDLFFHPHKGTKYFKSQVRA